MRVLTEWSSGEAAAKRQIAAGVLAALLFVLSFAAPLHAGTLRCGSEVIQRGAPASKVQHYCGEPARVEDGVTYPYASTIPYSSGIETWTYNFGPADFMYVLTFRDGKLIRIEREGHGY